MQTAPDTHTEAMKAADEIRRTVVLLSNRSVIYLAKFATWLLELETLAAPRREHPAVVVLPAVAAPDAPEVVRSEP